MTVAPVQTLPTITSVEDAIEAAYGRVVEIQCSLHDAICDLWPNIRFDQMVLESLAIDGLVRRAQMEKEHRSAGKGGGKPAVAWGAPHGHKWHDYLNSLTHVFKGVAETKALYYFAAEDLAAFALSCRTMVAAYERRANWATETQAVLASAGKERIADLPAAELKAVAEAAAEAFRRPE